MTRGTQQITCQSGPILGTFLQLRLALSLQMGLTGSRTHVNGGRRVPSPWAAGLVLGAGDWVFGEFGEGVSMGQACSHDNPER